MQLKAQLHDPHSGMVRLCTDEDDGPVWANCPVDLFLMTPIYLALQTGEEITLEINIVKGEES